MSPSSGRTVLVGDRRVTLTNLDKVLYPATGTTKGEVIAYYAEVAPWMLPHVRDRPVTRKRWANGVDGQVFFEKNLPASAPDWIVHHTIHHKDHDLEYPVVDDLPTLTWMAQQAALELHVPQWRFAPDGTPQNPDRLVLDLDPGDGVGLAECVEVAFAARRVLEGMGLAPMPVTSGSKGIHLYAPLDGTVTTDQVSAVAHELANALAADMPDLVLSHMSRAAREGKVFVDWSQNNGNKTTIAPYSLRGRDEPTVAAPRTWDELEASDLRQLTLTDVVDRVQRIGDPLHPVAAAALAVGRVDHGHWDSDTSDEHRNHPLDPTVPVTEDRLAKYRSMRDASRTPEPVPDATDAESGGVPTVRADRVPTFVIQEHHASRLHYDFRLEHDGVLVSWALPKGEPEDPAHNHLAVQTEDHPLEYGSFEGTIPGGEYGGGTVTIWDAGTIEVEKWRDGQEVIVTLHGRSRGSRRLALVRTHRRGGDGGADDRQWLIHRTKEQPSADPDADRPSGRAGPSATAGRAGGASGTRPRPSQADDRGRLGGPVPVRRPMLASAPRGRPALPVEDWAFEMKWDGVRAIATIADGGVSLVSRNGNDLTDQYPELQELLDRVGVDAVLDGEVVALDHRGRPDFGRLQNRMGLTGTRDVARAARSTPVRYEVFDVLEADGRDLTRVTWTHRREALATILEPGGAIDLPEPFDGPLDDAVAESVRLGHEGVVAKRRNSRYSEGRRSEAWVKMKHHRTQEVVVGGWKPGAGRRAGGVGSLVVGVPADTASGGLNYVGRVGTGFRDADLDAMERLFDGLGRDESPFDDVPRADARDVHWLTPTLVGEVEFAEWTSAGRLRQPSWRGWRPDKRADQVVRES